MTNTNVTPIESKQTAPAARFQITATLDGFPVQIEAEGRADALRALVDRLLAIGAEPPTAQAATKASNTASAPLCPVHGSKMKPSRKPGSWYCPRRTDDGDYCPEKA